MADYLELRTLAGLVLLLVVFGLAVYWITKVLVRRKKEAPVRKRKEALFLKRKKALVRKKKEALIRKKKERG